MIVHYYNEWDKGAAAWLRELINNKLIPYGYVDERSITEVTPSDLEGFTQCHFFAGIGGWPLALKLAGVPASTRLWTGSPPCQPFSVAGKSLGFDDERHLAPAFLRLIRECEPELLFGEQVAAAIGKHWLDFVFLNLEEKGYSCASSVLPACSVGAPHKRDRLFFGAYKLADTNGQRLQGVWSYSNAEGWQGQDIRQSGLCIRAGAFCVAHAESKGQSHRGSGSALTQLTETSGEGGTTRTNPHHGFWSDADWLGCRDRKFRPVEPGTFPLANGIPSRVGRLRGYGNAIVPQVAAEFVKAFMESIRCTLNNS